MNDKDMEERLKLHKQMDDAINKTFSGDKKERETGRQELEKLRGQDEAVPFFIGYAHKREYDLTGNIDDAEKALKEYNNIVDDHYDFLKAAIHDLKAKTGK